MTLDGPVDLTRTSSPVARARRRIVTAAALGLATALLAACGSGTGSNGGAAAAEFPSKDMTWIISAGEGSGFDTTARTIQPFLEKELDTNFTMLNRAGGGFSLGPEATLEAGDDCHTIMIHGAPGLQLSMLTQDVGYTLQDFAPIGSVAVEPSTPMVGRDAPWTSFGELIEDAKARPGQIRLSVSGFNEAHYAVTLQLQKAAGVQFNIIPYQSGGEARLALVNGEVDLTYTGVFNGQSIIDRARPLAIWQPTNEYADLIGNVPTVSSELSRIGVSGMPEAVETRYVVYTTRACRDTNPAQFARLVQAFGTVLQSPDYRAVLQEQSIERSVSVTTPEEQERRDAELLASLTPIAEQIRAANAQK